MPTNFDVVAAETGHPVYIVRSKGIAWCRKNPCGKGDEFDQTLPDGFDDDCVAANASDAETLIADARASRVAFDAPISAARQKLIFLRREAAKGGIKLVGSIGNDDVLTSRAFSEEEADALEPAYRDALRALAASAPGLASYA